MSIQTDHPLDKLSPAELCFIFRSTTLNTLTELNLITGPGIDDEVIRSIAKGCPLLEILCLLIREDGIKARSISKMHNLKQLKLTFWECEEDEDWKKHIRDNKVIVCDILEDDLIHIFSNKNLSKLQSLSLLDCDHMNDKVLKTIALNCSQLKNLNLQKSDDVSEAGIEFVRENCPNITKLEFYVPSGQPMIWFTPEGQPVTYP